VKIIRDPQLYSDPLKIFRKIIKTTWPAPEAGAGVVCLFPTQPLLEYWEQTLVQEYGSYGGARFLLFDGLIREIWEETRPDWTWLSGEAVTLILRKIFLELKDKGEIPYYGQALESPGFFSVLNEEITTLKRSGITARVFADWLRREPPGTRPAQRDFSLIYQRYQDLLVSRKWADAEDKLSHATVDLSRSLWVKSLQRLYVIGFSDFTSEQERFLRAFARTTEVTALFDASAEGKQGVYSPKLRLENKRRGADRNGPKLVSDSEKEGSAGELDPESERTNLAYLQRYIWRRRHFSSQPESHTRANIAQGEPKERLRGQTLSSAGERIETPQHIAVTELSDIYGRVEDKSVGFLEIDGGWRREMKTVALEVKQTLAHNPLLSPAEIGIITPYTGNLEEIYRIFEAAGLPVTGQARRVLRFQPIGRALLQPFITAVHSYAWPEMIKLLRWGGVIPVEKLYGVIPEGLGEWRRIIHQLYPDLETEFIFAFLEKIPDQARIEEYFSLCRFWLTTPELLQAFLPKGNGQAVSVLNKKRFMQTAMVSTLQEVLAKLATVFAYVSDWEVGLADFVAILEDILSNSAKGIVYGWGNGIRILTPQEARGLRFQVTFITGVNEGLWPTHTSIGWVLDEGDLTFWRRRGFSLRTSTEDLSMQRLVFYNALTSATAALKISCCRSDEDGHPVNPSTFWEDLRNLLPNVSVISLSKGFALAYSTLPSPDNGENTQSDEIIKMERNRRRGIPAFHGMLDRDESTAIEIQRIFTHKPIGITVLEEYAACPFAFFCQRLLRLDTQAEPTYLPDRMDEGSIMHNALRDFFRQHRGEALQARDFLAYLEELKDLVDRYYPEISEQRPLIYRNLSALNRETLLARLTGLLKEEISWQEKTGGAYRPHFLELGFGGPVVEGDEASTERCLEITKDQARVRLKGKIDRVDLGLDGGFIVYDYKSGSASRVKAVKEGKLLQLPLYLQALEELFPELRKALGMTYYSLARSERTDGFWREGFGQRHRLKLRELKSEEWRELIVFSREKSIEYYSAIITGAYPLLPPEGKCPTYCRFKRVCRRGERPEVS